MNVELIYDADCPNVTRARSLLIKAFTRTGVSARWLEWERSAPDSPAYARSFGSPTILIDGKDVVESDAMTGSGACRVYNNEDGKLSGTPPMAAVCAALRQGAPDQPPQKTRWQAFAASTPALGVALLPKLTCPLCFPAYAALLSALGIEFIDYTPYLAPLTVVFLAIALGVLALQARRSGNFTAMLIGVTAAAIVLIGKFHFDSTVLATGGVILLMIAILLGNRAKPASMAACPACVPGSNNQQTQAH